MRVLITGASGFAGGWLARACAQAGDEVVGVSRSGALPDRLRHAASRSTCVTTALARLFADTRPEVVYHLAALSSRRTLVGGPGRDGQRQRRAAPWPCSRRVRRCGAREARVVWASSCEVYGVPEQLPVDEDAALAPANPYAVSKAAGDMLAAVYVKRHGLPICPRARRSTTPVPASCRSSSSPRSPSRPRRRGSRQPPRVEIVTGNPDARRDFTDVRDVVRAYRLLAARCPPGVYNVCSAVSASAAENVQTSPR